MFILTLLFGGHQTAYYDKGTNLNGPHRPTEAEGVPSILRLCYNNAMKEVPTKVTVILIPLAMALCAFGIFRGEMAVVLAKAVNICLECIGIG